MMQSPSWEANWFAASQEIPHISRNPKVHYRTHKHPPPVSILGQPNPVHIPTSYLLEIHPNIMKSQHFVLVNQLMMMHDKKEMKGSDRKSNAFVYWIFFVYLIMLHYCGAILHALNVHIMKYLF